MKLEVKCKVSEGKVCPTWEERMESCLKAQLAFKQCSSSLSKCPFTVQNMEAGILSEGP